MTSVYVLKLEQGKYYVGKTNNIDRRIEEHFSSQGCEWTSSYKPIEIIETVENVDDLYEDFIVKRYMRDFGIDNVRGGAYVQLELSFSSEYSIFREIAASKDACMRCFRVGHFIGSCTAKTYANGKKIVVCYRCGQDGHYADVCQEY
eukprot:NODE_422_length_8880_cov_0.172759.p4 type:complete len:147 gc:universal NODE_422_length_8880_cov_0.172759:5100-5540(+)